MKQYRSNPFMRLILALCVLFVAFNAAGCAAAPGIVPAQVTDGQMLSLSVQTTFYGMVRCIQSQVGTSIYQSGNAYIFMWSLRDQGMAWIALDVTKAAEGDMITALRWMNPENLISDFGSGNVTNWKTGNEFVTWMRNAGFTKIDPRQLPLAVTAALTSKAQWVAALASVSVNENTFLYVLMPSDVIQAGGNIQDYINPVIQE